MIVSSISETINLAITGTSLVIWISIMSSSASTICRFAAARFVLLPSCLFKVVEFFSLAAVVAVSVDQKRSPPTTLRSGIVSVSFVLDARDAEDADGTVTMIVWKADVSLRDRFRSL